MAATTTTSALPATAELPVTVLLEDDASPVVRLVGQALRASARGGHAGELLGRSVGTVTVRSHDTPQVATVRYDGAIAEVGSGGPKDPDATIVVDLMARFTPVQEPVGDAALASGTLRALRPPLPHWREAAERFWELTRDIPGMPDVLVVDALEADGPVRERFGAGATEYLVEGPTDLLSGVFSGADDLVASLGEGLRVQGTLSQLSVMTAASWKARFDV